MDSFRKIKIGWTSRLLYSYAVVYGHHVPKHHQAAWKRLMRVTVNRKKVWSRVWNFNESLSNAKVWSRMSRLT